MRTYSFVACFARRPYFLFLYRSPTSMPSPLSTVLTFNAAFCLSNTPVALFVGGTSDIGQGMAEAFTRHTKGNAHIVFVGHNRIAGAGATHEFVEYDILAKTAFPLTVPEFTRLVSRPDCSGIFSFSNFRGTELSGLVRNICTMSVCFEWESESICQSTPRLLSLYVVHTPFKKKGSSVPHHRPNTRTAAITSCSGTKQ
jgi:hypothetical protein